MLLTLTELAEQARRIARAGRLCVLVDADHGYGNALNVMRTVEELASAGASGISIEDTLLPRAFGAHSGAQLLTLEEGLGKMKAAVRARGDSGMAIFARTSAHSIAGIDEAGRGALAGPVVAAAAILPERFRHRKLNDSKQLSPELREEIYQHLTTRADIVWAVGIVDSLHIHLFVDAFEKF